MPRFAILQHDHPVLHWDLLLEDGDVLLTWRLSAPPDSAAVMEALKMFDHRRLYLDYEGPISGDRGNVTRWDVGTFEWEAREQDGIAVRLFGARLHGLFRLEHLQGEMYCGRFNPGSALTLDREGETTN